jgi:hypothetical protein
VNSKSFGYDDTSFVTPKIVALAPRSADNHDASSQLGDNELPLSYLAQPKKQSTKVSIARYPRISLRG